MSDSNERRSHKRIKDQDISVKLSGEGFSAITQSLDVSASGLYCKVENKIPVMTRLKIALSVPPCKNGASARTITVEGVVVREHPVYDDGQVHHYDVAIFFDSISPRNKKVLNQYISQKSSS